MATINLNDGEAQCMGEGAFLIMQREGADGEVHSVYITAEDVAAMVAHAGRGAQGA